MTDTPPPAPIAWTDLETRQIMPGFVGRFIHSERMTFALWEFTEGAVLPLHSHPHEQVIHVLDGRLSITVGGVEHRLGPGEVLVVPADAPHEGVMLTDARVLDVFAPVREDYRGTGPTLFGGAPAR
jgi:quercetin dioxygenase-like cupin family protein